MFMFSLNVDLYKGDDEKKYVFVAAADGAGTGAEYRYETAEDIGKILADYLEDYYPDVVENPSDEED